MLGLYGYCSRRQAMSFHRWSLLVVFSIMAVALTSSLAYAQNEDPGSEFVREVLEEDYAHYKPHPPNEQYDDSTSDNEKEFKPKPPDTPPPETDEERQVREKKEKIQQQREAAFEAELAQMSAEKQKIAKQQKRRDARVVRRVLRASQRNDLYAILGLRNIEYLIANHTVSVAGYRLEIPGIALFRISPKAIKSAFRKMAVRVHPDKNKDGRAVEAFIAVEEAAAILADEKQRIIYDEEMSIQRRQRRKEASERTMKVVRKASGMLSVVRKALGPFAFPVLVVGSLVV